MITVSKNGAFTIKIEGMDKFMRKISRASPELRQDVSLWLEGAGFQFLEEVQRTIQTLQIVDTRRLLNSFDKGTDGNIWSKSFNGLELTVGTNVDYARYVNDGHWTDNPSGGRASRFVPGHWRGDRFIYDPRADTGMVVKLQYIPPRQYFEKSIATFEPMFKRSFENKLIEWGNKFKGAK